MPVQPPATPTYLVCVGPCPGNGLNLIKDGTKQIRCVVAHLALQRKSKSSTTGQSHCRSERCAPTSFRNIPSQCKDSLPSAGGSTLLDPVSTTTLHKFALASLAVYFLKCQQGHVNHLEHTGDALQAHACVHVLGWQGLEAAISLAVELDEHQVPDLQHVGVI